MRHAKSSWDEPAVDDHDRPLASRGARAARRMAAYLRSDRIRPALVLCSSARRTRDTLEALRPALGKSAIVEIEPGLYGAGADEILQRLRTIDERVESVMVIGHNPGLEDLALDLAGDGEETALAQLGTKFPTGALAMLDLQSSWAELGPGLAYLRGLVLPRQLPG